MRQQLHQSRPCRPLTWLFLLFCLVLGWMVLSSPWYEPSQLLVEGEARPGAVRAKALWRTRWGFNDYQRVDFVFLPYRTEGHELLVEFLDERTPASNGTEVVLCAVIVDGQRLDLASLVEPPAEWRSGVGVHLARPGAALRLRGIGHRHLRIEFQTSNQSGKVRLTVDGRSSVHDLYLANEAAPQLCFDWWLCDNEGRFSLALGLPRYAVHELELHGVPAGSLRFHRVGVRGPRETCTLEIEPDGVETMRLEGTRLPLLRWLELGRFAQQIVFAALTTWIIGSVFLGLRRRGGLATVLLAPQRRPFWLMFCGGLLVYGLWLAAFWPGVMSVDSLNIWRAARLPELLLNDHPLINVLLYRWLQMLWDHVAVVSLLHVVLTSLTISWIFFRLRQWGFRWPWLLAGYLFLLLSVPVGVYTTTLWKDVPFALLTLFWAFTLAELWRQRRSGTLRVGWQRGAALVLLFGALVLLRHNGLVYLVFIPLALVCLGIVPWRPALAALAVMVVGVVLALTVLRVGRAGGDGGFVVQQGRNVLHNAGRMLQGQFSWSIANSWKILDISRQGHPYQDKFHETLADRQAWWFLKRSGWSDVYPYEPPVSQWRSKLRAQALRLYHASLAAPWVYLSWNPVWLLPLLPLALLFGWRRPEAAIFSATILVQVIPLLVLARVLNWRYYYFVCLVLWFLPALFRGQRPEARG
ncbi:MAG: hypothetical protein BWK76_12715 [Desulfobulbaceae bacterium A2]|nr:MAG: hypothetical protein BWK76_12715 [Desulfobulbaceae bacterium A2]